MKYSVLMTVYIKEQPEHLKLALESIYDNQTRKPDEIVVVFDGELTEELYSTLDEFRAGKEDIVFYYPQAENKGSGEASRIGAEKCTGDYIFRMDSDDISLPDRFEKQIAYIEEHPEIDVLGGNIAEFNESPDEENKHLRILPQKHEELLQWSKRRNPINNMTVCIKRSSLEKSGGYQTLLLLEDYYLWVRMLANGCIFENLNDVLVYARVGNGMYSRRASKVRLESFKKLHSYMLENHLMNKREMAINGFIYRAAYIVPPRVRQFVYENILRK